MLCWHVVCYVDTDLMQTKSYQTHAENNNRTQISTLARGIRAWPPNRQPIRVCSVFRSVQENVTLNSTMRAWLGDCRACRNRHSWLRACFPTASERAQRVTDNDGTHPIPCVVCGCSITRVATCAFFLFAVRAPFSPYATRLQSRTRHGFSRKSRIDETVHRISRQREIVAAGRTHENTRNQTRELESRSMWIVQCVRL